MRSVCHLVKIQMPQFRPYLVDKGLFLGQSKIQNEGKHKNIQQLGFAFYTPYYYEMMIGPSPRATSLSTTPGGNPDKPSRCLGGVDHLWGENSHPVFTSIT